MKFTIKSVKFTLAALALVAALSTVGWAEQAAAGESSDSWTIRRDTRLDGSLWVHQNLFLDLEIWASEVEGVYIETAGLMHHNSVFRGQLKSERDETLLFLWQTNDRGYHALHIGRRTADGFVGSWLDNEGNQGDFELLAGELGEAEPALEP